MLSERAQSDIRALRARYPVAQSALLPALLRAQEELGWVPPEALAEVARLLDLPVEVVAEVASFYTLIFTEPVGRHVVQLCTNVSCLLSGAEEVRRRVEERLGIRAGQTTPDGRVTLLAVECLAACDQAPCAIVDEQRYGPLTPEAAVRLVEELP
ncbi:NADH-quinone oxidoreductase subunit E [bacterium HR32]|nr:NADH-quinone oxidoreductase subunit E [bacterium HR32]